MNIDFRTRCLILLLAAILCRAETGTCVEKPVAVRTSELGLLLESKGTSRCPYSGA